MQVISFKSSHVSFNTPGSWGKTRIVPKEQIQLSQLNNTPTTVITLPSGEEFSVDKPINEVQDEFKLSDADKLSVPAKIL